MLFMVYNCTINNMKGKYFGFHKSKEITIIIEVYKQKLD